MPVEVVHWNPDRAVLPGRIGRVVPWRRPVNNFGDLIGPLLVSRILELHQVRAETGRGRLVSVGSIMKLTQPGDVVWGTGVNGKSRDVGAAPHLDVRSVRGPLTRQLLQEAGTDVPEVFGDPGLLWSRFHPRERYLAAHGGARTAEVTIVPNLHDWADFRTDPRAVDPRGPVDDVIRRIALSDFVTGSSLHGIVIAESLGVPARLIRSKTEPAFKYEDYYLGSGRPGFTAAARVGEAIDMGGEPALDWDASALLGAFPLDLWGPSTSA